MEVAQSARETFGLRLGQTARIWRTEINRQLLPHGLTESRWRTLRHLSRMAAPVTQKELAAGIGVQGPTLVRTLDWLEAEGLIERRASANDRRAKSLHLTHKALPSLARIQAVVESLRNELFAGIEPEALQCCLTVFDHIAEGIARVARTSELEHGDA